MNCSPNILAPALTVYWVNGAVNRLVFRFDTALQEYVDVSGGFSAGRVVLRAQDFVAELEGVVALRAIDGGLQCNELAAFGGVATMLGPRLEFRIGNKRVATVTKGGRLAVAKVSNGAVSQGGNEFHFYNGSAALVAKLGLAGMVVLGVEQPVA